MKNDIELKDPFIMDLTHKFDKMSNQFESINEFKKWLKNNFGGYIHYNGTHRYGADSSTEESDIIYKDIHIGHNFIIKVFKNVGNFELIPIEVTHKHGYIIFWKSLISKETGYFDCGANSRFTNYNEKHSLPKSVLPIEVIYPDFIDISDWKLPKIIKKTKIKYENKEN